MNTPFTRARRLCCIALLLTATVLQAATTFYVAPTGSDAAAGTSSSPFQTIQRGVNAAASGDTVLVAPGTYAAGEQTTTPASGYSRVVIDKNILVRSTHGAAQTVIQGRPNSATQRFGSASVRCVYMSNGTLDGFTLADGYADASDVLAGSDMTNPVINGGGVYVPDAFKKGPKVKNCIITRCGAYRGGGAHCADLINCTVVSNYINSTSGAGVFSCRVRNSIVMFNGASNDKNYPSAANSVDESLFTYSCTSPTPVPNFFLQPRDGGNNLITDPLFAVGTFRLSDTSPCINAGDNGEVGDSLLDAGGNARIQGSTVDMGAYERSALYNTLTVIRGSGSGSFTNGAVVPILADATNAWIRFDGWTGAVATVANTAATNTTLLMPNSNITVVATFHALTLEEYLGDALGIPLPITTGNLDFPDVDPGVPEVLLGGITDGQAAFFTTVYTNAGTLLFPWRVSSEAGYDRLVLLIDGQETNAISGFVSGVVTQYVAGAGEHQIRWEYRKDGSDSFGEDAGWVGAVTWIPNDLAAELGVSGKPVAFPYGRPGKPLPFPYGFEACFLDAAAPSGAAGGSAVKLGGLNNAGVPYIPDNATNGVEVVLHGSGELAFRWFASNSLSDVAICTIDGMEAARISGTKSGWVSFTTNLLTVAAHRVRWSYAKNPSAFSGADAVWIDNVMWTQDTFTLTVENGTGGGTYAVGDTIAIAANPAPAGQTFDVWDGDTGTVDSPLAPATTLTMPGRDITVRALYKTQRWRVSVVNGRDAGAWPNAFSESTGEAEGEYPANALVRIVAAPAPLWQTFLYWTNSAGVVFTDDRADVSMFTMPSTNVTVTAVYRAQTADEKLANALTIRGQPLTITSFSPNGVIAEATGGIRYNDPVVKLGGPSVGPGQSVSLSTTNFTGNGFLLFWWRADAEAEKDGVQLEVNGTVQSPLYSEKTTNTANEVVWYLYGFRLADTTNVTWRFTRDTSYYVHDNMVLLDRVTWIPGDMVDELDAFPCFPNINNEYDPLFEGRNHFDSDFDFEGEDGGVAWVHDAPGGGDAIRLGRFGYVTNNACAQVAVTNFGTGFLTWEWTASSEGVYDTLGFYIDGAKTNEVSGKNEGLWEGELFYVSSALIEKKKTSKNIFAFRYQKDEDVSMLEDCGWVRNVRWFATHRLVVDKGSIATGSPGEEGYFIENTPVTIIADPPEEGYYFDCWTGTNAHVVLGAATNSSNPTFLMPGYDLSLTATYTTNTPAVPHYTLTVEDGTGDGSYLYGTTVPISATPLSQWQTFAGWTGDIATIANPSASPTTILIGSNNLAIAATFASMPLETILMDILGIPAPVGVGPLLTLGNIGTDTVNLGLIGDNQTNFITTVYTNAGTVIFPWAVDCEEGYDFFRFSIDGTNILSATGTASGILTNFVAGPGPHILRWSYEKDYSESIGSDSATIGPVTWIPDALAEELGTPGKTPYAPNGFAAIELVTAAGAVGNLAVRVGGSNLVAHGASAAVGTVFSGSGKLSFHWSASSELSHDYLILSIDGRETARISGTKTGWLLFETNLLTVANHAVQWTYVKDGSVSKGSDCGWVDSVTWTQFKHVLTVQNGSGSGTNAVGSTVAIVANAAPAGMEFDTWDGDTEWIADPTAPATTLVMPARDIIVRALYRPQTFTATIVNGRDGGAWPNAAHESTGEPESSYPAGAEVRIIAEAAPLWQTFAYWISTNGAAITDTNAAITTFVMPSNSVTVTAMYRAQTDKEKLADALTIAGQPLNVTAFSPNGVVAESSGGVRYNDPVVKFGGPSVGAGQSVELTFTNFTGNGVLLFWWKGNAETAYDEVEVRVNGSTLVGAVSGKGSNWQHMTNVVTGASSITLRFQRDGSYFVRDNTVTIDRLIWIPQALISSTGCLPCIPEINGEVSGFSGEDGGVSWANDAPGGGSAIRFGQFGYVNNNQHAQLSVTNYGTGILRWEWASSSEAVADRLDMYGEGKDDGTPDRWVSGKEEAWVSTSFVVKNGETDRDIARRMLRTFLFKYSKDSDVSVFKDCAWLRNGIWAPTFLLALDSATNINYTLPAAFAGIPDAVDEAERNIFPAGTVVRFEAVPPADGYYFDSWEGNLIVPSVTNPVITMPSYDVFLRATYTTNVPPASPTPPATPAPQTRITALSVLPASAQLGVQSSGAALSPAAPSESATVVLQFEGASQTDYALEWATSLSGSEATWQPLTVIYREVLGDQPNGTRLVRLYAQIPADAPQGFFRLKGPSSP